MDQTGSIRQSAGMSRLTLTQHTLASIIAIQIVFLAALAVASVNDLRDEAATERRLSIGTARSLVLATIGTLQGSVPHDRLMSTLSERLVTPANSAISVLDARDDTVRHAQPLAHPRRTAPDWFTRLMAPSPHETRLPVVIDQRMLGFVVIASDPTAQIATAWRNIQRIVGLTAIAAAIQGLLILWITKRALRPVRYIAAALTDLSRGQLDARVDNLAEPDLAPIGRGVNELATALERARDDRDRLQRQVVTRADQERKAIARDLHDEMGPCLFGLRVEADALAGRTDNPVVRDHAAAILRIADEISDLNRALLDDLRPAAIGQLPLAEVLNSYVEDLAARFPNLTVRIVLPTDIVEPDEATALTLFRIMQEGTTNALRHSAAKRIEIALSRKPGQWIMTISDDGEGIAPGTPQGAGLSGMAERITLLSGRLDIRSDRRGTVLTAQLPRDPAP